LKHIKAIVAVLFISLLLPLGVFAQESVEGKKISVVDSTPSGTQNQNKNKIQVENQGEDDQIQTENQEEEGSDDESETSTETAKSKNAKLPNNRSQTAREHMSTVALKVEELLAARTTQGGIGEQIREVAREQNQAQEQIEGEVTQLENRNRFMSFFFGPDSNAMGNLNGLIEQNQVRITELQQLAQQVTNEGELTLIQETIQELEQQNTALQDYIDSLNSSFSIFGWFKKIFLNTTV